jgi:hypothetical protein
MTERTTAPLRSMVPTEATGLFESRLPRGLIALGIVTAIVMGGYGVVSYVMTPWAHASSDRGALVGYWQGEMVLEPGDRRQVALHLKKFTTLRDILLDREGTRGGAPTLDIRVAAKVCGPGGSVRYHGSGDVADREGTRFTFGLEPDSGAHGRHPGEFRGLWVGKDRLELASRLSTRSPDGASAAASITARPKGSESTGAPLPDRVIRFEMRRSTEENFDAAC